MTDRYLLDTSVLSLLAPGKPTIGQKLSTWLRAHREELYAAAVSVMEIEQGIRKLRRVGAVARADTIERWLDTFVEAAQERLLPLDVRTAKIAGELSDRAFAAGRHPGFADVAIAATARAHGLTILTQNTKHFASLGVAFVDPADLPSG